MTRPAELLDQVPPPRPWRRSTPDEPCPMCRRAGCLITGPHDHPSAVVCRRVKSPKAVGELGYLHVLRDDGPTWAAWRNSLPRLARGGRRRIKATADAGQGGDQR
jgi:hypothetical protein